MDILLWALLIGAGVVGGAVNAIAGGGTFFTFPALMAAGLDPLTANATNAVAIYPGHAAAVPAYKGELRQAGRSLSGLVLPPVRYCVACWRKPESLRQPPPRSSSSCSQFMEDISVPASVYC
jgi:hypothetical protein